MSEQDRNGVAKKDELELSGVRYVAYRHSDGTTALSVFRLEGGGWFKFGRSIGFPPGEMGKIGRLLVRVDG